MTLGSSWEGVMDVPAAWSRGDGFWTGDFRVGRLADRGWWLVPALVVVLPTLLVGGLGCGSSSGLAASSISAGGGIGSAIEPAQAVLAPAEVVPLADEGARLYERLCASCHGVQGDGAGPSARFLYPRPRNFRQEPFRMVSTTNMVPSDDDLLRTLDRGMPGSSMFSFGHLSLDDRKALVTHIRSLVRKGLEDRFQREAADNGEEIDPQELAEILDDRTRPGPTLELPAQWPNEDAASVARGRELYVKATCAACHGETGRGDGIQEQKDEMGMPIRPRDYTQGVFKGGRDCELLYARIALGVPGTPMPSSPALKPDEIADLVHFIRSMSDPATENQVVHRRSTIRASRAEGPLPETIPDAVWDRAEAVPIVVSPLWWRDDAEPDLRVQAIHDGKELAVRLTWKDATRDSRAIGSDEFPDMASIQLFQGSVRDEPFLGMGAKAEPVDVWLWNAAAQADRESYADVDTAYPNMIVDSYPDEAAGNGPRPHATDRQPKDFLTAWKAGNQRSDPTRLLPGSHLAAEGPGSATLRPPIAQDVKAHGVWNDGRWTVVLRRSMSGPTVGRVSIAFALWDGTARDRNGQKLASIWHDLERP